MKAYIIMVKSKKIPGAAKVSLEGYKTLEAAQAFCMSRANAEKFSDWCYESTEYYYVIYEVDITE